jgi:trans-2,3-dihydro-3-hydroxyanthranilate isomerase
MARRYVICDVFTKERFGGNQLAVLPDAAGLSDTQMQRIAREFNFSETSFVFPPEQGHTRKVRIFTPLQEVPFAGHPNVGTAFVLAQAGEFGDARTVAFEEQAGFVAVDIHVEDGAIVACELEAPGALELGATPAAELVAGAAGLASEDIVSPPQVASVGLPFVFAEVRDRATLARARIHEPGFRAIDAQGIWPCLHLYTRVSDEFDIRARMFAPLAGVPEDPATGSANCALAGLLAHGDARPDANFMWRIAQGVEMGRPSTLVARAQKRDGAVIATRVGGPSVLVAEGVLHVD